MLLTLAQTWGLPAQPVCFLSQFSKVLRAMTGLRLVLDEFQEDFSLRVLQEDAWHD